jgi:hypothetical protein
VKKITKKKKKNSGSCEEWMFTLCDHVFKGSYTRVWHHLLSLSGEGVKGCTYDLEKRMELTKLNMSSLGVSETDVDNARRFKVPRVVSSSQDRQDSMNQSQLNQVESEWGSTSERSKRSTSVAAEQIHKIYNVVHRDEADDVVADFLMANGISLMPPVHHITKKW